MGDKVQRIIVGRDGCDDTERFAREPPLARLRTGIGIEGNDLAGVSPCLFCRELQRVHAAQRLLARLDDGFAGFANDGACEVLTPPLNEPCRLFQNGGAVVPGQRPCLRGPASRAGKQRSDIVRRTGRNAADKRAIKRIENRDLLHIRCDLKLWAGHQAASFVRPPRDPRWMAMMSERRA
ncbi:hypothetical protein D9M70_451200 [compost metagenome]